MEVIIRTLKANHGDCILITCQDHKKAFNVLIDGGDSSTFKYGAADRFEGELCLVLDELKAKKESIDLLILTHIDDDHIAGLLKAFQAQDYLRTMVNKIWFNSSRLITSFFNEKEIIENNIYLENDSPLTSVRQGKNLEALLDEIGCNRASIIKVGEPIVEGPFKFTILSPDEEKLRKLLCIWPKEESYVETSSTKTDYSMTFEELIASDKFIPDTSITNGSSIAFILEVEDKRFLFLGDSHEDIIVQELTKLGYSVENKLFIDFIKLSHHGSQYNTSMKFLSLIDSPRFIVSTNGLRHGLPNKRTIARILKETSGKVYFNYENVKEKILLNTELEYSDRVEVLEKEIRF